MDRRKALQLSAAVFGGALVGAEAFLSGCAGEGTSENPLFSARDVAVMDEIGETILPESAQSPGAKAAHIGAFMQTMVSDCYSPEEQAVFTLGLKEIDSLAQEKYASGFLQLQPPQRQELLGELDQAARQAPDQDPPHYFTMMKQLAIWGYFTSEPGATIALRYNPIPGGYRGCVDYEKGGKAWF